jgi:hypothetical protein
MTMEVTTGKDKAKKRDKKGNGAAPEAEGAAVLPPLQTRVLFPGRCDSATAGIHTTHGG